MVYLCYIFFLLTLRKRYRVGRNVVRVRVLGGYYELKFCNYNRVIVFNKLCYFCLLYNIKLGNILIFI